MNAIALYSFVPSVIDRTASKAGNQDALKEEEANNYGRSISSPEEASSPEDLDV